MVPPVTSRRPSATKVWPLQKSSCVFATIVKPAARIRGIPELRLSPLPPEQNLAGRQQTHVHGDHWCGERRAPLPLLGGRRLQGGNGRRELRGLGRFLAAVKD